jgi:hypothetical protein
MRTMRGKRNEILNTGDDYRQPPVGELLEVGAGPRFLLQPIRDGAALHPHLLSLLLSGGRLKLLLQGQKDVLGLLTFNKGVGLTPYTRQYTI